MNKKLRKHIEKCTKMKFDKEILKGNIQIR